MTPKKLTKPELEKLKDEYLASWQRARADLINYKAEESKRAEMLSQYFKQSIALKILPVLDSFDLAEQNLSKDLAKDRSVKGILQIKDQIESLLKELGVEEIEVLDKKFNPEVSEAIEQTETKNKQPGTVVKVLQKGYKFKDQLIRSAKVKVNK